MRRFVLSALWAVLVLPMIALANDAAIKKSIKDNMPGAKIVSIKPSPIKQLFQVELQNGTVVHVSADGSYLVEGDLYGLSGGVRNLTEEWRSERRVGLIKDIKDEDAVVFPANGVEKGVIFVFTDTSCGYCQKFHAEVPEINAAGITVKYLAWPRYGLKSADGQLMTNVWCSADRRDAMTRAKTGQPVTIEGKICDTAVIERGIELGHKMSVRGTPAIFDKDGRQLGGYVPAQALVKRFAGN
jgi:thiol:disulfide interchange protein DsbC